jgi:uncharacterized lipoprotein NlpE involved in copper resistance
MRISSLFAPLAATLILVGCGNKEPASKVVAQAESILGEMRNDGATFAPDELKAVEATTESMKADFASQDYKKVMEAVPTFNGQVKTLKETVVSKQAIAAASANEWNTLNAEVPKTVEALQVRVDALTGTRLPKEITKETFTAAKTELEGMKSIWAEATAAAAAGDTVAAADKGRLVAAKGEELKNKLGMNPALAATMAPPAGTDVAPAN